MKKQWFILSFLTAYLLGMERAHQQCNLVEILENKETKKSYIESIITIREQLGFFELPLNVGRIISWAVSEDKSYLKLFTSGSELYYKAGSNKRLAHLNEISITNKSFFVAQQGFGWDEERFNSISSNEPESIYLGTLFIDFTSSLNLKNSRGTVLKSWKEVESYELSPGCSYLLLRFFDKKYRLIDLDFYAALETLTINQLLYLHYFLSQTLHKKTAVSTAETFPKSIAREIKLIKNIKQVKSSENGKTKKMKVECDTDQLMQKRTPQTEVLLP